MSDIIKDVKPLLSNKKFQNLIGTSFSYLTVVGFAGRENNITKWYCKCICGNIVKVNAGNLKCGSTKSCGCLQIERTRKKKTTHGHSINRKTSKTYAVWATLVARCTNPNNSQYSNYGGRGIKVCNEWLKFEGFLEDMGEVPDNLSIDRIENDKGYYKENCRWATGKEQMNNRRCNVNINYMNKNLTLTQWSEELNISATVLFDRIQRRSWSIEKAFTTPVRKWKKKI